MSSAVDVLGIDAAVRVAALVLGHFLADFVFQSQTMVAQKARMRGLLQHGFVVFAVHAAVFLPFLGARALLVLALITVLHLVVDRLKILAEARFGPALVPFVLDQAIHVGVAIVAGLWLAGDPVLFELASPAVLAAWAFSLAGAAFLGTGGSAVTRILLRRFELPPKDGAPEAGHLIGVLERLLVYVLVLGGQWAAAALVVAVKSLARFESLKDRAFAEYYLVGTLASVLQAVGVGMVVSTLI